MLTKNVAGGVVHKLPRDLQTSLLKNTDVLMLWHDITPLARNAWICWVEEAKQPATRIRRIDLTSKKLLSGMRRPCCWQGCSHRERNGR